MDGAEAPDVFVSYASADLQLVAPLLEALERAGVATWVDTAGIDPFDSISSRLRQAIRASRAVVVC